MDNLNDDVLALMLEKVEGSQHRRSCAQVNRQWLRIEGVTRRHLRILSPELAVRSIHRYPSITSLEGIQGMRDADLAAVSRHCPSLQVLNLALPRPQHATEDYCYSLANPGDEYDVITDEGLEAVANGCSNLKNLKLRWRLKVGDHGLTALAKKCLFLEHVDLSFCKGITDDSLKALSSLSGLKTLILRGCWQFGDVGLGYLASGPSKTSLDNLFLRDCGHLTDLALQKLQTCSSLTTLCLAECGPRFTDFGLSSLGLIPALTNLDLSWLSNLTDHTIVTLVEGCANLRSLVLTGCEFVTDVGVASLSHCEMLESLDISQCPGICGTDIEALAVGCLLLQSLVLSHNLRCWISKDVMDHLYCRGCTLRWS